jgi:hypothetical protein
VVDTKPRTAGGLRRGDRVRLRSLAEIEATLDVEGRTDALPFMREMLSLQDRTFCVDARADKTCDTINMAGCSRKMSDTVHLAGVRCDGSAHGGCQALCLLFFKEQWLERVPAEGAEARTTSEPVEETRLTDRLDAYADAGPGHYRCQATQLLEATSKLKGNSHYLTDLRTNNVDLRKFFKGIAFAAVNRYQQFSYYHFPKALLLNDGHRIPDMRGTVRNEAWPEASAEEFAPGTLVEVRGEEEIKATLDDDQRNRGLWFDEEMTSLFGKRGRVLYKVERLIDEKTGRMLRIRKDLYVVDGMVSCEGVFHKLCSRKAIAMLRASWLRRVDPTG